MTAGPWDPRAARRTGHARLRAADTDREQVIDILKAAFVQGRLGKDEFCLRAGQALAARTYGELAAITSGIPARLSAVPPPRVARVPDRNWIDKRTATWGVFLMLMPATLAVAFLTHFVGFFVLFLVAFIGTAVTAQPDS